jgi:hypothetical protein
MSDSPLGDTPQGDIGLRPGDSTVTLDWQKRSFKVVPVFEFEVRGLLAGYTSLYWGLFGIFAGLGFSCLTTYYTAGLAEPLKSRYFAAMLIFLCFAGVFLILSVKEWFTARNIVKDLLRRQGIPPQIVNQ